MSIKVSVIVPVYNVEKELEECIYSILNQEFDSYEIICVEDCSTDKSYDILKSLAEKNPIIRIEKNDTNLGLSASRNRGLRLAQGEYVWFVDSDDIIETGSIRKLYYTAKQNRLDVLYFNKDIFHDNGWGNKRVEKIERIKDAHGKIYSGEVFFCLMVSQGFMPNAYTQLLRKEYLTGSDLYFYDGIVHEDMLFYPIAALGARRVSSISDVFYHYRKREGSITSMLSIDRKRSLWVVLIELIRFWGNKAYNENTNKAMATYLEQIYFSCKYYDEQIPQSVTNCFDFEYHRFVFDILSGTIVNKVFSFNDEEIDLIKRAQEVYIYGAGVYGRQLFQMLRDMGIVIKGFIVSNANDEESYKGIPIKELSVTDITNSMVIVAVSKKYRLEIEKELKELGYCNYIVAKKRTE